MKFSVNLDYKKVCSFTTVIEAASSDEAVQLAKQCARNNGWNDIVKKVKVRVLPNAKVSGVPPQD